ncbi:MAG: hypothetical protein ACO4AJ_10400 [Prochlorothrix sp.]
MRGEAVQPNPNSAVGTAVKICIHRGALIQVPFSMTLSRIFPNR